ncbi:leucine-rich repeat domain-containing protein [Paracidovorax avenae]|uniref:leucine-rich repeat domain-containing protein n=1 Tax=Paracidovorax avenae TaxID=80867 RepID=UPI000D205850|nr:leucine-rich repeat domain-containing protein [Paracidovorax avenae]AVS65506.1 leucine-rich repeat domain-containing protein [Paracidovorax avenae]
MTSPLLTAPFGASVLSFMPPERGGAFAAARQAAASTGTPLLHAWYEALQAWCEADAARQPPGQVGASEGLRGLFSARRSRGAVRDERAEAFAGRCREFAAAAARILERGDAAFGAAQGGLESREIAVGRLLLAHAEGAPALDLHGLGLTDLPPGLETLDILERLDISWNPGLGALPERLARCRGLRAIDARHCGITEVPPQIVSLPRLETLDLSENAELRALPAGWRLDDPRLRLEGTPLQGIAGLLRPLPLTPRQRGTLAEHMDTIARAWPLLQARMRAEPRVADQVGLLRARLSLAVRTDGMGTQEACEDAHQAIAEWLDNGDPLTTARTMELGWRINFRPSGTGLLRTQEYADDLSGPQGAGAAAGAGRPSPCALPPLLAALESWLSAGDAPDAALDPLSAMERAVLLYRALVVLRPLHKGNEPTALAAMDWALQEQGLPPVLLPDDPALPTAVLFRFPGIAAADAAAELLQETVRHMDALVARLVQHGLAVDPAD